MVSIFTLWFFRDPERKIPHEKDIVLAAADGRITEVNEIDDDVFLNEKAVQIVTFLSPLDVHINRAPVSGVVKFQERKSGKHYPAFFNAAGKNEKNYIGIQKDDLKMLVVQMVGIIARRIVSWVDVECGLERGQRIGFIRFGSRTDVIIPKTKILKITVKKGDIVKAGETVIAKLNKKIK